MNAHTVADVEQRLVTLEEQVRLLLARDRARAQRVDRADARLLAAIADAIGGRVFTAAMLLEYAAINRTVQRRLKGTVTPQRLGIRLLGLEDRDLNGLVLRRVKREGSGTLWVIELHEPHDDPRVHDDGAV